MPYTPPVGYEVLFSANHVNPDIFAIDSTAENSTLYDERLSIEMAQFIYPEIVTRNPESPLIFAFEDDPDHLNLLSMLNTATVIAPYNITKPPFDSTKVTRTYETSGGSIVITDQGHIFIPVDTRGAEKFTLASLATAINAMRISLNKIQDDKQNRFSIIYADIDHPEWFGYKKAADLPEDLVEVNGYSFIDRVGSEAFKGEKRDNLCIVTGSSQVVNYNFSHIKQIAKALFGSDSDSHVRHLQHKQFNQLSDAVWQLRAAWASKH